MIIRDKQDLRRCVKQAVRRSEVVETRLDFDVQRGETGVGALMDAWVPGKDLADGMGTPLHATACSGLRRLNAPVGFQ